MDEDAVMGDDLGIDASLQARRGPHPFTEEQQKQLLAQGRAPHSGRVTLDTRILIVVGVLVIAIVVMVLFFSNMAKSRTLIREQTIAMRTAQLLSAELKQYLPPPLPATKTSMAVSKQNGAGELEPPVAVVCGTAGPKCKAPNPQLWAELGRLSARSKLADGQRLSFWVLDIHGWVYADTKDPSRALDAATQSFPNANLFSLSTVPNTQTDDTATPVPTSVGAAILQSAAHGAGIVNFSVPSLGTTNTTVINVTLFVQPIGGTDFLVAVQVGSKSSLSKGL